MASLCPKQDFDKNNPRTTKDVIDERLWPEKGWIHKEQVLYEPDRSSEWQSILCLNFINFQKTFNNVDGGVLWSLLQHWGIPSTFNNLVQCFNPNHPRREVCRGLWDANRGQTRLLAVTFDLSNGGWLDHTGNHKRWQNRESSGPSSLEDLDFADDLVWCHRNVSTCSPRKIGKPRKQQRHVLRSVLTRQKSYNQHQVANIKHSCRPKPKMKTATYLGSIVLATGWTDEDIKAKIGKGRQAFITLKSVWRLTALSAHNLLCIYNRKVKSILLCGSEMWSHQYQLQQTADLH